MFQLPSPGPFPELWALALRKNNDGNIFTIEWKLFFLFFLFSFLFFFLSPTPEAVVFQYRVVMMLRKVHLPFIYARRSGEVCLSNCHHTNTFSSANICDANLAINSPFVFQGIFGKDLVGLVATC